MRSISLTFVLMLFSKVGLCQPDLQTPFPDTNSIWEQLEWHGPDPANPNYTFWDYSLYPYGDTTINTLNYTRLRKSHYTGWDFVYLTIEADVAGTPYGYYRQDSNKVYYMGQFLTSPNDYYFNSNNEVLLYDFNLVVGDTFNLAINCPIVVESIDSIQINYNWYRRWNFNCLFIDSPPSYSWVEGIGSTIGFLPYYRFFESGMELSCFYQGYHGILADIDGSWGFGSCLFTTSLSEETIEKRLLKITDLMGRETEDKSNTPLIYIYSDGTTEKVFRIE